MIWESEMEVLYFHYSTCDKMPCTWKVLWSRSKESVETSNKGS